MREKFSDSQFHNTLRPFNAPPKPTPTTSQTMGDYYPQKWHLVLDSRAVKQPQT